MRVLLLSAPKTDPVPIRPMQQFWRNTDDADVIRFLKLFTELSMDEIHKLEQLTGAGINEAKVCRVLCLCWQWPK